MGQQYQQPPPPGYGAPPPQQQYQAPPAYGPRFMHADIVHRFIALLIDCIILGVLYAILAVVFVVAGVFAFSTGVMGLSLWGIALTVVWFLIALMYFMFQEGGPSGATIGKKVMHLKVVDTNYQPIDMSKALIRNLMRLWFISGLGFIILIVDIILILTRPDKQRLGDIVAHTYVVENRQMGPQPYYAPPPPPQQQQQPQQRMCLGCGRQIPQEYCNCPNCGRPVQ